MRKVSRWIVASLALWLSACSTLLKTAEQVPWSPVTLNTAKEADLLDVTFTQQTGWLVGSGTTLLKSTDGGKTWLPPFNKPLMGKPNDQGEPQPLLARFLSVSFTEDGKEGWLAGEPRI